MRMLSIAACLLFSFSAAADKNSLYDYVDAHADLGWSVASRIWEWAEPGYQETRSSRLLQETLREAGFRIEAGVADIPTAFVASYGSGSPIIGILGEFDALPGLSQTADPVRKPAEGRSYGHACGHHLFGAASMLAAMAVAERIEAGEMPGTVRFYGTPAEEGGAALQEFGLPYAADPVVSKHLARFLRRSLENVRSSEDLTRLLGGSEGALEGEYLRPTAVLFNGGVFKAAPARERLLALLGAWSGGAAPRELAGFQPDLAVAKGAACYGRNRVTGKGIRIRAGTARSYYIGLESSRPAVPGFKPPVKALCVVPQGMEEGSSHLIEGRQFGLVTGKPAVFRFFSSEARRGDAPGAVVANAEKALEETNQLEITLPAMEEPPEGHPVPVQLNAVVTELGNLELWMQHVGSKQRWKVEFQVRME